MKNISKSLCTAFSALLLIGACQVFSASAQKAVAPRFERADAAPVLKSARNDYSPGDTATFGGNGFAGFEETTIAVEETGDDSAKNGRLLTEWTVYADARGDVSFDWTIPASGKFVVTVTGKETGRVAAAELIAARTVELRGGKPHCKDLNPNYLEFKIETPIDGTYNFTDGSGNQVTVDFYGGNQFVDFKATIVFPAVIVQGAAPGANVYFYNPAQATDKELSAPSSQNISRVSFCYVPNPPPAPATINIVKDARPATSQPFSFTVSGQITDSFTLVDNNPDPVTGSPTKTYTGLTRFGAANTVTITEIQNVPFYNLTRIQCSSDHGVSNNTFSGTSVTIQLEPGEVVNCTFRNEVTTAASASVSGSVLSESGRSLARATVTIQNLNTMETQTVSTNAFGRYHFDNLATGDVYLVTVRGRKGASVQSPRTFVLNGDMENLNFTTTAP